MTDPTPRQSSGLPAWMTLPGSLATGEDSEPAAADEGETAPAPGSTLVPAPASGEEFDAPPASSAAPVPLADSPSGAVTVPSARVPAADTLPAAPADTVPGDGPEGELTAADSADTTPRDPDEAEQPGATPASEEAESGATPASDEAEADAGAVAADEEWESGAGEAGPGVRAALEAILLVVDEPVAEVMLAQVLEKPTHEVVAALRELSAEYTADGRGFDLREVAGGWRFYTRADCAPLVERFVRDGQQTRLTQAALETLAVVAYRQPVSRARVAAVRGVNSDGVMRTLVARGLVEEAGTDPESQAVLYRTSSYFLERLGLKDISELPELAPFLPDDVENLEETTK